MKSIIVLKSAKKLIRRILERLKISGSSNSPTINEQKHAIINVLAKKSSANLARRSSFSKAKLVTISNPPSLTNADIKVEIESSLKKDTNMSCGNNNPKSRTLPMLKQDISIRIVKWLDKFFMSKIIDISFLNNFLKKLCITSKVKDKYCDCKFFYFLYV